MVGSINPDNLECKYDNQLIVLDGSGLIYAELSQLDVALITLAPMVWRFWAMVASYRLLRGLIKHVVKNDSLFCRAL